MGGTEKLLLKTAWTNMQGSLPLLAISPIQVHSPEPFSLQGERIYGDFISFISWMDKKSMNEDNSELRQRTEQSHYKAAQTRASCIN